jgi:hypothetical protein
MMLMVTIPNEPFGSLVRQGVAGATLAAILGEIKPEAAYFTDYDGKRTGVFIVDVPTPADVPRIAEPFFLKLNAACQFHVVMSPEDLQKSGLNAIASKWG